MRARRTRFTRGPTAPRRGCAFFGTPLIAGNSRDDLRRSKRSRPERFKPKWFLSEVAILLSTYLHKRSALCSKGGIIMFSKFNIKQIIRGRQLRLIVLLLAAAAFANTARADAVIDWNVIATTNAPAAGKNAIQQSRIYAMTHAAIHDALNAIDS